ncbi:MAG: hypothetical protein J7604_16795 [Sporocytophaga sp.]|uniref:hypothetical protein n=1 Tax=Sporocytophaga sp. TaxID=2231183 RepID=UPI001B15D0B7|nr:hypothetical protein [Sporocytophaga sp.]MBO9701868.1 hypothetical protein [Sporocytophaga sp.]
MSKILLALSILILTGTTSFKSLKNDSYTLSIEKGKAIKEKENTYWVIPTTLTNNSNDTLKYYSMSCSWQDFYSVDNRKLQIDNATICDKNILKILTLVPGQKQTVEVRLLISQTMDAPEIKFRIGFNLIKVTKKNNPLHYHEILKKKNVIWSNEISM